jgi:hypothetical protein
VLEDENKEFVVIEKSKLPHNVKEGDVIFLKDNNYIILYDESKEKRKELWDLQNSLFE